MLRIAFSTLAGRKGGMLGAFAAVGLAVVLVVSCGILVDSSLQAPVPVQRLSAAKVLVQADPTLGGGGNVSAALFERRRLPAGLAARLEQVPGIRAAVADRSFATQVIDARGHVLTGRHGVAAVGHGWESAALTPFALASGHAPRSAGEIVVTGELAHRGSLRLGDHLRVVTATSRESVIVAGIATAPAAPRLTREAPIFFRSDVARRLSGTGDRADLIALLLEPGAAADDVAQRVRGALAKSGLRVLTGSKRGEAESPEETLSRADTIDGLTVFGAFAAFVAIFVVASTFALSVQQRHREFALFRAIGSTPRQVRKMVAGEALLVSLAAVAIASPISIFAARRLLDFSTRTGMVPEGLQIIIGWRPFAAGLVAAVVTTQLAAFASARRASRIRPTDALRESSIRARPVSWVRALAGLAAVGGGAAVLMLSGGGRESSAPGAAVVWMIAVALLGPLLAWPFSWLIGLPLSAFSRGPGMLARANTRANLRRVASVATPLMLAVTLVVTIFYGKSALGQATIDQTAQRTTADYVLSARTSAGLQPDVAAAARALPGVRQVSGSIATTVIVTPAATELRFLPARAVDAETLPAVIDLGLASGSLKDLHGAALAVAADDARDFGWHVGERVHLWLGDGTPVTARVAAIFTRPLGFGDIVLPRALVERHVTDARDDAVFVSGGSLAALEQLRKANPDLEITTRKQFAQAVVDAEQQKSLAVYVLLGLIVVFCALAAVNAVMMSTAERAREFAMLRLIGAGKRQIATMVRAETLIMVAFGLAIGTCVALPGVAMVSRDLTGSAVPSGPVWVYGALVGFFGVLAFAASGISARLALRMDPVRAMAARE
jgi:putative ABC transport system permease protein